MNRAIILRLGRKLGFDALRGFIPESDQPLLTHIERQERRHQKNRERVQAAGGEGGDHDSDDSDLSDNDSDDDEEVRIQRPKVTVADGTINLPRFRVGCFSVRHSQSPAIIATLQTRWATAK
jgi:hypothetical protein